MATKKLILQVSYPLSGNSAYKTLAFLPTTSVEEARDNCAQKGGVIQEKDNFGLCIKDTGEWLKLSDTLEKYNLQNKSGLEFKLLPTSIPVVFEGEEKSVVFDITANASEGLTAILEAFGEPKSSLDYGLSVTTEDGKISIDLSKRLFDQVQLPTKLTLKKKSKIGGIFRRAESVRMARQSTITATSTAVPGVSTRVFGAPLAQVSHPAKYGGLPVVVVKCLEYLEEEALELEGIFRISGNQTEVLALKKSFDDGLEPDVRSSSSAHVVSGLLKLFLRDLPEPLMTHQLYESFISIYKTVKNPESNILYYKVLIDTLPQANQVLLFRLLPFLASVVEYEAVNKMAIHNVATVFGPNILRSSDESAIVMIQDTAAVNGITCDLIKNYSVIIAPAEYDFIAVAKATFNHTGGSESELSFEVGDLIFVVKQDDNGWWEGEVNGNYGFLPSNYVEVLFTISQTRGDQSYDPEESDSTILEPEQAEPSSPSESLQVPELKSESPSTSVLSEPNSSESKPTTLPSAEKDSPSQPEPSQPPQVLPSEPQISQPDPVPTVPVVEPEHIPNSSESRRSRAGTGGNSKKQFLLDLDAVRNEFLDQTTRHTELDTLTKSLRDEIALCKRNSPSAPPSSSEPSNCNSESLQTVIVPLQNDLKTLSHSRNDLKRDLHQLTETLQRALTTVEVLAEARNSIRADFKIAQTRISHCEQLLTRPPGSSTTKPTLSPSQNTSSSSSSGIDQSQNNNTNTNSNPIPVSPVSSPPGGGVSISPSSSISALKPSVANRPINQPGGNSNVPSQKPSPQLSQSQEHTPNPNPNPSGPGPRVGPGRGGMPMKPNPNSQGDQPGPGGPNMIRRGGPPGNRGGLTQNPALKRPQPRPDLGRSAPTESSPRGSPQVPSKVQLPPSGESSKPLVKPLSQSTGVPSNASSGTPASESSRGTSESPRGTPTSESPRDSSDVVRKNTTSTTSTLVTSRPAPGGFTKPRPPGSGAPRLVTRGDSVQP